MKAVGILGTKWKGGEPADPQWGKWELGMFHYRKRQSEIEGKKYTRKHRTANKPRGRLSIQKAFIFTHGGRFGPVEPDFQEYKINIERPGRSFLCSQFCRWRETCRSWEFRPIFPYLNEWAFFFSLHSANRFCSALHYFSETFQVKYSKLREVLEGHACESIQSKWEGQESGHDAGGRCAMFGTVKQQTWCKEGQYLKREQFSFTWNEIQ